MDASAFKDPLISLHFQPESHTYTLGNNVLPSVTEIIDPLQDWADIPEEILAYACAKGLATHAAIQLHNENDLDVNSLDLAIVPRFEAWLKFLADKTPEIVGFERPMYSYLYRYAGTPDLWIRMDKDIWLLDIKPNSLFKWYPIQLSGYQQLLKEELNISAARRATLQLKDDGKYKFTPYSRANDVNDMSTFLACLRLHQWREKNDCKKRN